MADRVGPACSGSSELQHHRGMDSPGARENIFRFSASRRRFHLRSRDCPWLTELARPAQVAQSFSITEEWIRPERAKTVSENRGREDVWNGAQVVSAGACHPMNPSASKFRVAVLLSIILVICPVAGLAQSSATTLGLLKDAAQSILAGDLQKAEAEIQSVLAADPKEYHALNFLGVVRAQQHREAEAEVLFKRVMAEEPEFAGVHVNLGL